MERRGGGGYWQIGELADRGGVCTGKNLGGGHWQIEGGGTSGLLIIIFLNNVKNNKKDHAL